jgi:hypothetical protein
VDDPGLGLVEREAPGLQPPGELFLDLLGLRAGRAQYGQVIGVPDQDRRSGTARRVAPPSQYLTPAACSMPCSATFMITGLITPP